MFCKLPQWRLKSTALWCARLTTFGPQTRAGSPHVWSVIRVVLQRRATQHLHVRIMLQLLRNLSPYQFGGQHAPVWVVLLEPEAQGPTRYSAREPSWTYFLTCVGPLELPPHLPSIAMKFVRDHPQSTHDPCCCVQAQYRLGKTSNPALLPRIWCYPFYHRCLQWVGPASSVWLYVLAGHR